MEAFSKFISIIILVAALFLLPLIHSGDQKDAISQSYVSEKVTSFVEDVKKQGKITQSMYDRFLSDLDTTKTVYDIELVHTHTEITPVFDADGNVSDVKQYNVCFYTDEILDGVYSHVADTDAGEVNGEYHLTKGDYITVTVKNRHYTIATRLRNKLFGIPFPKTSIYVTYGGRIQDENY